MNDFQGYDQYRYDEYTVLGRISTPEEHLVEDARSRHPAAKDFPINNNGKTKRHRRKGIFLTVLITILAFSATLFGADLFSSKTGVAAYVSLFTGKKNDDVVTYYAVYATSSEDMGISYKNAAAIRAEGGAGYVLKKGDLYYVFLNAYAKQSDAEKVAKKDANYSIYEITIPAIKKKKKNDLLIDQTTENLYRDTYLLLYRSANDLASGSIAEEDVKRNLQLQKERIVAAESAYCEKIKGKEDNGKIEFKVFLAQTRSALENLCGETTTLVADIRYYSIMILNAYALFVDKYLS